jgi:hypothetical protein
MTPDGAFPGCIPPAVQSFSAKNPVSWLLATIILGGFPLDRLVWDSWVEAWKSYEQEVVSDSKDAS